MPTRTISVTEKGLRLPMDAVQRVATGRFEPDSHSTLHFHSNLQIYFVTEGKGALQFPLRRCFVYPGDIVLINPNVQHTEYSSQLKPLEYIAVELDQLEYKTKIGNDWGFLHFQREDFQELLSLAHMIQSELTQKDLHFRLICSHLAEALLLRLLREDSFELIQPQRSIRDCRFIHNYITEHFAEKNDLDSLAALADVNKYHLAHTFKELYGYPINVHLQKCRIQEATRLLRETKLSITEICHQVGFHTLCHFTNIFREHMGMTPRDYRKTHRK